MNDLVLAPTTAVAMPRDALSMFQLAQQLCKATAIPAVYKNPADLCLALIVLNDLGIKNPLLALSEMQPVRGNQMMSGKLCLALANTSNRFAEKLTFVHSGEGENRMVLVSGRLHGETEPRVVEVRLRDVRTANDAWKRQPDQQLVYAGARIWMRRHTPEIILGMYFEGETIDVTPTDVTTKTTAPLRLHPSMSQGERTDLVSQGQDLGGPGNLGEATVGASRTETSEVEERVPTVAASDAERAGTAPFVVPRPDDSDESWRQWWETLIVYVRAAPDVETINDWTTKNAESIGALQKLDEAKHDRLIDQIRDAMAARDREEAG